VILVLLTFRTAIAEQAMTEVALPADSSFTGPETYALTPSVPFTYSAAASLTFPLKAKNMDEAATPAASVIYKSPSIRTRVLASEQPLRTTHTTPAAMACRLAHAVSPSRVRATSPAKVLSPRLHGRLVNVSAAEFRRIASGAKVVAAVPAVVPAGVATPAAVPAILAIRAAAAMPLPAGPAFQEPASPVAAEGGPAPAWAVVGEQPAPRPMPAPAQAAAGEQPPPQPAAKALLRAPSRKKVRGCC